MTKITEREASRLMASSLRQIIEYYDEQASGMVIEREALNDKFDTDDVLGTSLQANIQNSMDISRLSGAIEALALVAIPALEEAISMIEADDAKPESDLILPSHVR